MNKIELIVWDFSGTILNDVDHFFNLNCSMLPDDKKGNLPSIDYYRDNFSFPVGDYYKRIGLVQNDIEAVYKEATKRSEDGLYDCELQEGVLDTLKLVKDLGLRQVILSTIEQSFLNKQVSRFGIEGYFDQILGMDHIRNDSKIELVKKINNSVDRENVLMVGDTTHDYEVASSAGWNCILISRGHQSRKALVGVGCEVVDSARELVKFIK